MKVILNKLNGDVVSIETNDKEESIALINMLQSDQIKNDHKQPMLKANSNKYVRGEKTPRPYPEWTDNEMRLVFNALREQTPKEVLMEHSLLRKHHGSYAIKQFIDRVKRNELNNKIKRFLSKEVELTQR